MSKKYLTVGIIAEDDSDVEALKELIRKILPNKTMGFKNFVGRGCGKIKRKCSDWAVQLKARGCDTLILLHDLDKNNFTNLHTNIENSLKPFAIKKTFISIPIEEMEAWFLADPEAIQKALNLAKTPKVRHNTETIVSPKEYLGTIINKFSGDTRIYLNTSHNTLISKHINVQTVKTKCKSFERLHTYVTENF